MAHGQVEHGQGKGEGRDEFALLGGQPGFGLAAALLEQRGRARDDLRAEPGLGNEFAQGLGPGAGRIVDDLRGLCGQVHVGAQHALGRAQHALNAAGAGGAGHAGEGQEQRRLPAAHGGLELGSETSRCY
jgi:hypothetical protein